MTLSSWFQRFWEDDQVAAIIILIAADIALGIVAAIKVGNFRFSYLVDFLRNDVLFKVVPYFIVYGAMLATGDNKVILGVLDFGDIAAGLFAGIVVALGASILGSLNTLREGPAGTQTIKTAVVAPENAAPPRD